MYIFLLAVYYIIYIIAVKEKTITFDLKIIMPFPKKIIVNIIFPLLSGIAVSFSYYSEKFSFLIFFALIPYLYSIINKFNIYKLFVYSFSLYFFSIIWITNTVSKVTDNIFFRLIISFFLISAISLILSIQLNFPFLVFRFGSFSVIKKAIIFPFIYIFGEWLQGIFSPIAFPWIRIGNIASPFTMFIQSASIFGTLFISLLILLINFSGALFFYYIKSAKKYIFSFSAFLIFSINLLFGYFSLNSANENKMKESSVIIVQGNFPKESKFTCSPEEILDKYLDLLCSCENEKADLILFPETSMHSDIYNVVNLRNKLYGVCCNFNSLLLFGSQYNLNEKYYNACMALFPKNKIEAVYLKRFLVPFGEYNPFNSDSLRFTATDFSAGNECGLIEFDKGLIGCSICYESIFPESVSESVNKGAEVITILTNDSWLGEKIPLYQHHSNSIMRAVENDRYVLTSTNTGISSVVSNKGKIITQSESNTDNVICSIFYLNNKITFYTKYGDIIILPSCLIIIFICIRYLFRQIYGLIFKKT